MTEKHEVYLDHSASTPVDARVIDVMLPYFSQQYGNPSASYRLGRQAERAIEDARLTIAGILNCDPTEIVFTSGGSESDNFAIRGAAWMARKRNQPSHLITTPIEHEATSNTVKQMTDVMGFSSSILSVDTSGLVDVDNYQQVCAGGGAVVSVIYANNEIGTVQDIAQLATIAQQHEILFHTDAVQAGGQLNLDVQVLAVDMLSLSAHKFYGPKGVGLLYIRNGLELEPFQTGGSHERGRRAGTHNTPYIVGMAKALEIAYSEREQRIQHLTKMRDQLIDGILGRLSSVELTGHAQKRLPSHASFIIEGVDANSLLMHLDMKGIAASSGSACKTGNPEPSQVLLALGYTPEQAKCGLRLSVGIHTTENDIDYATNVVVSTVEKLRELNRELAQ